MFLEIFTSIVIVTIFANKFLSDYYKFAQVQTTYTAIKIALKRSAWLCGFYSASIFSIFIIIQKVVYRINSVSNKQDQLTCSFSLDLMRVDPYLNRMTFDYNVRFFTAFATPFVLVSSFVFAIFGGVGLAYMPLRLVQIYIERPVKMEAEQQVLAKKILLKLSEDAIKTARAISDVERDLKIIAKDDIKSKIKNKALIYEKNIEAKEAWLSFEEHFEAFRKDDNILKNIPVVYLLSLSVGIVFIVFSVLFVINTALSIFKNYVIFEKLLEHNKDGFYCFGIITLFVVSLYFGIALMAGSSKICRLFHGILNSFPIRKNKTFTHSFFLNLNIVLMGLYGMMVHIIRSVPNSLRFSEFDFLINQLVVHVKYVHYLYRFHIFEYLLVFSFLITVFKFFLFQTPTQNLRQKIKERIHELKVQREQMMEMETVSQTKIKWA